MSGLYTDVLRYANHKTRPPHEVLLTAALSFSIEAVPQFRSLLLKRIAERAGIALPVGAPPSSIDVVHQRSFEQHASLGGGGGAIDRPDILLRYPSGSLACIIECKLHSAVPPQQASRYARQLLRREAQNAKKLLVEISSRTHARPDPLPAVDWASLSWTEVADLANAANGSLDGRSEPIARFLLNEFVALLKSEAVVFRGFTRDHLGEAAAHASVAFGNWYELVRSARDSLGHLAVPISEKKTRLSRNFREIGYRAKLVGWDGRRLRRTKIRLWIGVSPLESDSSDWSSDWYPAVNLWFNDHPDGQDLIADKKFLAAVKKLDQTGLFYLDEDGYAIRGDHTPFTKIISGIKKPLEQWEAVMKYWESQLTHLKKSTCVQLLLE